MHATLLLSRKDRVPMTRDYHYRSLLFLGHAMWHIVCLLEETVVIAMYMICEGGLDEQPQFVYKMTELGGRPLFELHLQVQVFKSLCSRCFGVLQGC